MGGFKLPESLLGPSLARDPHHCHRKRGQMGNSPAEGTPGVLTLRSSHLQGSSTFLPLGTADPSSLGSVGAP